MKHNIPRTPGAFGRPAAWGSALALAAVFLMGSSSAFAAAPQAGASISNRASVSYLDTNGNAQVASSNAVITIVQQVGSFTLDAQATTSTPLVAVNNKAGAAGAVIYAPHVLTNTGNGTDSFNISVGGSANFQKVEIYSDTNSDGLPDSATPLCTTTNVATGCSVPTAQAVAGSNGTLSFVVAYTIPPTASGNNASYDIGKVTVTPVAASTSMYVTSNQSVTVQDNVSLTTSAAFDVTQSFAVPQGIAAPSGGAWPTSINGGKRSSSASCATTWSSTLASSATCTYTTYTITYKNNGGAAGRFNLQDVIGTGATSGFTYVTGSAVWGPASGTALGETAGSNSALNVDLVYNSGTKTLTFVDNSLPLNTTRTLTFAVLVNNTAVADKSTTTNTVTFNPVDATGATASAPVAVTTATSQLPFLVSGTYSIVVGTAASATASDAQDTTAGTPLAAATDTQTLAKVAAGKPAVFTHTIYNLGNAQDIVNVAVASNNFPTGTIFRFYKADGTTQLSDTNADGTIDTGPIPMGSSVKIIVTATVPTTTAANAAANYNLVVLGTSAGDNTIKDASADNLTAVTGPFVDLTNNSAAGAVTSGSNADLGTGPSAQPTVSNASVPAGSWTTFDLWVSNNDSTANSYALSASSTTGFPGTLPSGWTVKFVAGATTAANCSAGTAITSTGSVTAGGKTEVTACVYVPLSQVQVTQAVYFQAKANSGASDGSTPVDIIYDQVVVTSAAATFGASFTQDGMNQIAPGGSVVYGHTLQATGTGTCAAGATVGVTLPAADVTAGWTYALYIDTNGNGQLDAGDTLITGSTTLPAVVPGTPQKLLVKIFAPGGAIGGTTSIATVTVTFPAGSNCGAPSLTDATTVVSGQIRINPLQAKNAACDAAGITTALSNLAETPLSAKPGECIVYQFQAINQGTAVLTNLNLSDVVPPYTTLTTVQPTTTCASTSIAPAFTSPTGWTSATTSVSCGNGTTATTVQPGGTATLTFQVQINQ